MRCHTECNGCNGPNNRMCIECRNFNYSNACIQRCPQSTYLSWERAGLCLDCHRRCQLGCYGPLEANCKTDSTYSGSVPWAISYVFGGILLALAVYGVTQLIIYIGRRREKKLNDERPDPFFHNRLANLPNFDWCEGNSDLRTVFPKLMQMVHNFKQKRPDEHELDLCQIEYEEDDNEGRLCFSCSVCEGSIIVRPDAASPLALVLHRSHKMQRCDHENEKTSTELILPILNTALREAQSRCASENIICADSPSEQNKKHVNGKHKPSHSRSSGSLQFMENPDSDAHTI